MSKRVAIITDAVEHLGPDLARKLAKRDHNLVLGGASDELAAEVRALGAEVEVVKEVKDCRDLIRQDAVPALMARAKDKDLQVRITSINALSLTAEVHGRAAPEIADALITLAGDETGLVRKAAIDGLVAADWPGNVRELRNALERALIMSGGLAVRAADLSSPKEAHEWSLQVPFPEKENLHDATKRVTRELIAEALRRGGTKKAAAQLLGISRHALSYQMQSLEMVILQQ